MATNVTERQADTYENYLAKDLPVIWQPNPATSAVEIATSDPGGHAAERASVIDPGELALSSNVENAIDNPPPRSTGEPGAPGEQGLRGHVGLTPVSTRP